MLNFAVVKPFSFQEASRSYKNSFSLFLQEAFFVSSIPSQLRVVPLFISIGRFNNLDFLSRLLHIKYQRLIRCNIDNRYFVYTVGYNQFKTDFFFHSKSSLVYFQHHTTHIDTNRQSQIKRHTLCNNYQILIHTVSIWLNMP